MIMSFIYLILLSNTTPPLPQSTYSHVFALGDPSQISCYVTVLTASFQQLLLSCFCFCSKYFQNIYTAPRAKYVPVFWHCKLLLCKQLRTEEFMTHNGNCQLSWSTVKSLKVGLKSTPIIRRQCAPCSVPSMDFTLNSSLSQFQNIKNFVCLKGHWHEKVFQINIMLP
jgi:hypothetical protein